MLCNAFPDIYKAYLSQYLLDIPKTALLNSLETDSDKEKVLNSKIEVLIEVIQKPFWLSYTSYQPNVKFCVKYDHIFETDLFYDSDTKDKLFINIINVSKDLMICLKEIKTDAELDLLKYESIAESMTVSGPAKYKLVFEFKCISASLVNAEIIIALENSHPINFDFKASFMAPQLVFSQTTIDLGYLPIFSECVIPVEIKNQSANKENLYLLNRETLQYTKHELENIATDSFDIASLTLFNNDNQLTIISPHLVINGNRQKNSLLRLTSNEEGCVLKEVLLESEAFLISQDLSQASSDIFYPKPLQLLKLVAHYERPEIALNKYIFNFERLSVNKQYTIKNSNDPKILYIRNLNNFGVKWRIKFDENIYLDSFECNFYPKEGVLEPLETVKIKTKFSVHMMSSFTVRFKIVYKPINTKDSSCINSNRTLCETDKSGQLSTMQLKVNYSMIHSSYIMFEYNFIEVKRVDVMFQTEENMQLVPLEDIKAESTIMETVIKN